MLKIRRRIKKKENRELDEEPNRKRKNRRGQIGR